MARGRFISKSMNENTRLEAMPIDCVDFLKRVITISDVEGRLKGSSDYLSKILYPLRDISGRQVEGWLNSLWNSKDDDTGLGLLERYRANGRDYIWLPGFDKHQKGIRKDREAPSEIPPPPKELMEKARQRIIQSRGKEEAKSKEEIRTDDLKVAAMIKYFEDETGRTLTPMDLERLVDFADNYRDGWFEKAVDEAVKNNARVPLRYIEKIMENWQAEGVNPLDRKGTKAHQGHPTTTTKLKESTTRRLR